MPELPEVETIARSLAPQIVGHRITGVTILHPGVVQAGASLLPKLRGAAVKRIFRRGKLLVLAVELKTERMAHTPQELFVAFHLKMTGRFFVHPKDSAPLKHTRLLFDLEGGERLFFDDMRTFGFCRVMLPETLALWPFWAALGPEPLGMSAQALAAHFAAVFAGRKLAIKAALLDQRLVAGVGNIYADESLFRAGILPAAKAGSLSGHSLRALADALQAILHQAIKQCGSSIRDYRDAQGNAGSFQNTFAVYGRKGKSCLRCGNALQSARVAGRGTVFCAQCQQ